ncbi:MAG: CerR family C-terminal domain-containing protein [Pirellulales bacterium]|nr:CerR family C-terminal domain-containing protein [Pirellulales bacterium]
MSSDDTRGRILNAAGEVFAERGFRAATIRDICHRAEVNLASVNYYFGDKERLYVEAVRMAHPGGPDGVSVESFPEGATPEQKLRVFIRELLKRLFRAESHAWKMRLLQREILEPTPFCTDLMRTYFRAKFAQLTSILDEVLPPEMPEPRRHMIAFSIVGQCVYFRAASRVIGMVLDESEQRDYHTVDTLTDHVSGLVLAALGLAPPLGQATDDDSQALRGEREPKLAFHKKARDELKTVQE